MLHIQSYHKFYTMIRKSPTIQRNVLKLEMKYLFALTQKITCQYKNCQCSGRHLVRTIVEGMGIFHGLHLVAKNHRYFLWLNFVSKKLLKIRQRPSNIATYFWRFLPDFQWGFMAKNHLNYCSGILKKKIKPLHVCMHLSISIWVMSWCFWSN
jgi:hypothetical protein